jgi:hypothetical protein
MEHHSFSKVRKTIAGQFILLFARYQCLKSSRICDQLRSSNLTHERQSRQLGLFRQLNACQGNGKTHSGFLESILGPGRTYASWVRKGTDGSTIIDNEWIDYSSIKR